MIRNNKQILVYDLILFIQFWNSKSADRIPKFRRWSLASKLRVSNRILGKISKNKLKTLSVRFRLLLIVSITNSLFTNIFEYYGSVTHLTRT